MRKFFMALLLVSAAGCTRREPQAGLPGQTSTASLASAMATARQRAPEAEPRRIWAEKDTDVSGAPSLDGTLFSYTDWVNGALGIRDLRTGTNRLLTPPGSANDAFPETSVFSSDGKRIAYRWVDRQGHDLRVIDVAGSEPRIIVPKSGDIATILPIQWTNDDREILAGIARADRTLQLAFVDVATGSVRGIRTFQWGQIGSGTAALSLDGRYLAMSVPSTASPNAESDVVILSRDGGSEVGRVESPGVDRVVGWTADGRIFYQSTRNPAGLGPVSSLFAVQTRGGKVVGGAQLVKSDMSRALLPRLTGDGRVFYGVLSGSYDVYEAAIDVANARILSSAARVTHRLVGFNQGIDWTADGRYAAYLVREGAVPRSESVLAIRDQASTDVRELRPELEYVNAAIRWSPDGRSIIAQATDMKGRLGVFSIDAQSGKATPIVLSNPKGGVMHRPQFAPDGRSIFYFSADVDHPQARILHRNLESGAEREVFAAPKLLSTFALSEDGTTLAVTTPSDSGTAISLVPARGGDARQLMSVARPYRVNSVTFSRDGKYLLFAKVHSTDGTGELWRIPVAGGQAVALGIGMKAMLGLRMHPDGRRIGFSGGESQMEMWVMDATKSDRTRAAERGR